MKGMKRFGVKGKLSPRYIGPFLIHEKCGKTAYKFELPPSLVGVHDIFHVSQLKKCLKAPVDVVLPEVAPLETDLTYAEHPIKILDQKESCHKAQDDQVLQNPMDQPHGRRSNMGKREFSLFSPSGL
jgi:hypothetical protein